VLVVLSSVFLLNQYLKATAMKYTIYLIITSMVLYGFYKVYFISHGVSIDNYTSYLKDPIFYVALAISLIVDFFVLYSVSKTKNGI
jgi:hypothetical protein